MSGAVAYALYNVFEPGVPVGQAKTPIRQLLDMFMDPTYSQASPSSPTAQHAA
jgi:hypothetical protein